MTFCSGLPRFHRMQNEVSSDGFPARRPSLSARASREAEQARIRAMTVEERMRMALSLHQQVKILNPQSVDRRYGSGS